MSGKVVYFCDNCGYESPKWLGKCPACGEWNTFSEEKIVKSKKNSDTSGKISEKSEIISNVVLKETPRSACGFSELDRVFGGGVVTASVNLIGGDPGIGKSTILLQICRHFALSGKKVLYVSGEESKAQIKMRAERIDALCDNIFLYTQNEMNDITEETARINPEVLVIDSIQTVFSDDGSSAPGTVSQVRECTMRLMRLAKSEGITVFIVGHMTKEGNIAGPKVLEHMVDCVLYFEGEKQSSYRIIRSAKNRFGASNEIAVFDMVENGVKEIANPSEIFISGRINGISGSVVCAVLEGTRPILAEIQSLAAKTSYNMPKRSATGIDYNRLYLILAVLEKRGGMKMISACDVYVNVTGGLSVAEPACDLAIALCIASGIKGIPLPPDCVVVGEVGLLGEIRIVSGIEKRISEAQKLGFKRCIIPYNNLSSIDKKKYTIEIIPVKSITEAFGRVFDGE